MAQVKEQIVAGTAREISDYLQSGSFGDKRLQLIVSTEEEDNDVPNLSVTFHNQAELEALLLQGLEGEGVPMTDQDWEDIRREVRERAAQRNVMESSS